MKKIMMTFIMLLAIVIILPACGADDSDSEPAHDPVSNSSSGNVNTGNIDNIHESERKESKPEEFVIDQYDDGLYVGLYNGDANIINIPASYQGNPIVGIAPGAFYNKSSIVEVNMPDSITLIDERSFFQCSNLEKIVISQNVTKIGASAFFECKKLREINFPDSITEIADCAFLNCESLENIDLKNTHLTAIPPSAFSATGIKTITIPATVVAVSDQSISGCTKLTDVFFDSPETVLDEHAFGYDAEILKNITLHFPENAVGIAAAEQQNITYVIE